MKNGEIIFKKFPATLNGVNLIKVDNIIFVNTNYHRKTVLNLLLNEKAMPDHIEVIK
jgi:hypothetical protein